MPSVVTPSGEAAELIGQPVDPIAAAAAWYIANGAGTKSQRRKQAAAFMLVRVNGWRPTDAAFALGYSPPGSRSAVERVRLALKGWWLEQAGPDDAPDSIGVVTDELAA